MESAVVRVASFSDFDKPSAVSWSPHGNIIAIALPPRQDASARVVILEPDAPHEHDILKVPLVSPDDAVVFLSFSPVHTSLTLLTATKRGNAMLWTPRQSDGKFQPTAVNTWTGEQVALEPSPLVIAKFLTAPSSFRWPPKDFSYKHTSFGIPLEKRFLYVDHLVEGERLWLRRSVPHFMTLDAFGNFQVSWKTLCGWVRTREQSLGEVLHGKILCGDVIAGRGATLRIAAVTDSKPLAVTVIEIKGYPRESIDHGDSFTVVRTCVVYPQTDHPIIHALFTPGSLGDCLLIAQTSTSAVALTKFLYTNQAYLAYEVSKRTAFKRESQEPGAMPAISVTVSPDGYCIALCIPHSVPLLVAVRDLAILDKLHDGFDADHALGAFGPNGVSFAVVAKFNRQFKLEVWSLSESSCNPVVVAMDDPKAVCMWDCKRLAWCLLNQTDSWDICQRVKLQTNHLPEKLAYFSLFYLDSMVHHHPSSSRQVYVVQLDRIKIRILQNSQLPGVNAVLIDLYSRRMILSLFEALMASFIVTQPSGSFKLASEAFLKGDEEACRRWIQWLETYYQFFCNCLKSWLVRSAQPGDHSSSMVPFVRLLGDREFTKSLSKVVYFFRLTGKRVFSEPATAEKYQTRQDKCCYTFKHINVILKNGSKQSATTEGDSQESLEAFREMVSETRKTCCGPVHLHYSRLDGSVTDDVKRAVGEMPVVKEAVALDQSEIESTAYRLGLLPDRALKGYLILKEKQQRNLFQVHSRPPAPERLPFFDCLRGTSHIDRGPVFYAVDQSCIANFTISNEGTGEEISRLNTALVKQAAGRSPFTGSLWKKL